MAQADVDKPTPPAAGVNGTGLHKPATAEAPVTPPKDAPQAPAATSTAAYVAAAFILVALLVGIGYELALAGTATDLTWTRVVYALGPVESIAFAAAGWIFGREVHRQQAQQAEARASQAQADARTAEQQALTSQAQADHERARGASLSAAVLEKARSATDGNVRGISESDVERFARGSGSGGARPAPSEVNDLAAIAAALYPEVARRQP